MVNPSRTYLIISLASIFFPGVPVNSSAQISFPEGYTHEVFVNEGLINPRSLQFDSQGNLFVGNMGSSSREGFISMVTPSGNVQRVASDLFQPSDLAIDPNDSLYVSIYEGNLCCNTGTVIKIDFPSSGFPSVYTFASGFQATQGIALDSRHNLFVVNSTKSYNGPGGIKKVSPDGLVSNFFTRNFPDDLVIDSDDNLYLATSFRRSIDKISQTGVVTPFVRDLDCPLSKGTLPMVLSSEGSLMVSCWQNGKIFKVSPDGVVTTFASGLNIPLGMAYNTKGDLFITVRGDHHSIIRVFSPKMVVGVDIKPGSKQNTINLESAGVIPVAILSEPDFQASVEVDPESVTLAGASVKLAGKSGKFLCHPEDVNEDGLDDLFCHVITSEISFEEGTSIVTLQGQTFEGRPFEGKDKVRVVGDNNKGKKDKGLNPKNTSRK